MSEHKRLVYWENYEVGSNQEEALQTGRLIGRAWLVDADSDLTAVYGDDWNDSPAFCNAGSPYEHTCKGLHVVDIHLGQAFVIDDPNVQEFPPVHMLAPEPQRAGTPGQHETEKGE